MQHAWEILEKQLGVVGGFKHMAAVLADVQHGEEGGVGAILGMGRKVAGDNSLLLRFCKCPSYLVGTLFLAL